jgi:hypothetical protein
VRLTPPVATPSWYGLRPSPRKSRASHEHFLGVLRSDV